MKNLTIICLSIIITILIAELTFRIIGMPIRTLVPNKFFVDNTSFTWSEPDKTLGWVNKAGQAISVEGDGALMSFWTYGRRATRLNEQKQDLTPSIAIFGGSNAQAYGVRDEDSFAYILGHQFFNTRIENFGTGGYGTVQTFLMAKRALEYFYLGNVPELIIVTFSDSHILRNVSDYAWVTNISDSVGHYISPPHYQIVKKEKQFVPFKTITPWFFETSSSIVTALHNVLMKSFIYNKSNDGLDITRAIFKDFYDLSKTYKSDFLVVVLEDYQEVSQDVFSGFEFPVLDCSGPERLEPTKYLIGGGGHPNSRMHRHYADCIKRWLAEYRKQDDVRGTN